MELLSYIFLGAVVASNNLAVSFALGALKRPSIHWRIITVFTLFETVIPIIGLFAGKQLSLLVNQYASYIGSAVLVLLGTYLFISAFFKKSELNKLEKQITSWTGIIVLGAGLSIDNLLVGISLGLKGDSPIYVGLFIGLFAFLFVSFGLNVGQNLSLKHRKITDVSAGFLLILLGIMTYFNWI